MPGDLLKFITCGSVDNGKSTLIGRMLYDANLLYTDHRELVSPEHPDFASLMDGLKAEREQGITIDVAYRYFATARRKFIVIDCPGHEQYTRNMVTGASNAEAAVILIDAQQGVTEQTVRHAFISGLMGIRHLLVAVNKIDLVNYDQATFDGIAQDFQKKTSRFSFDSCSFIPVSALMGDNLLARSANTPWYTGPALLDALESIEVQPSEPVEETFYFQVQYVNVARDFRAYCGRVSSGAVHVGDEVFIMPYANRARVSALYGTGGKRDSAGMGENVSLCFDKQLDISRGDFICRRRDFAPLTGRFTASLIWMSPTPPAPGESFFLKLGSKTTPAVIAKFNYALDISTQEKVLKDRIEMNDLAFCELMTNDRLPFFNYRSYKEMGGFILISRSTNETVACGMMEENQDQGNNIFEEQLTITKQMRARLKMQQPCIIYLTGLSSSGKSTIANRLERDFYELGKHTYILDGDNVRGGLNQDLRFSDADRHENIRRISEVARLLVDAGLIVIVAAISPFKRERDFCRSLVTGAEFIEVYVNTPLAVCEQRDRKGLYKRARRGEIEYFTGITSPYEPSEHPEIVIDTTRTSEVEASRQIIHYYLENMREQP